MDREGWKGSITVFLSITCILFLSLICAVTESARVQGARTQSANITGVGTFSLLSEYENALLESYEILALDCTYGSGIFKLKKAEERFEGFLSANANPGKNFLAELCTDPWKLTLKDCAIEKYQLLTDNNGEAFYQQAVDFMKVNTGSLVISQLLECAEDAKDMQKYQEDYEAAQKKNETQISELEEQRQQKLEELQNKKQEEQETDVSTGQDTSVVKEPEGNPLKELNKLRKKSILSIVTGDKNVSQKKISLKGLPSRGVSRKGNYKVQSEHNGLSADVLFREYLLLYFPNYLSGKSGGGLDYQLEYIVGGKASDILNLKEVINRLLLLREGMNYLYCLQDEGMIAEAGSTAAVFTGFLGIPAVTTATQHALLLAWAYGESLVDVRILLDGGKVPLKKGAGDWKLSMENLGRITDILQQGAAGENRGISYHGYLRMLLNLGNCRKQRMRALDMIQTELTKQKKTENFKAENCITAVRTSAQWECRPMFRSLPNAVLGTGSETAGFVHKSSISY